MQEFSVRIEGVSGEAMTREFQQRAAVIEGVTESSLQRKPVPAGEKAAVGEAIGALLKLASEKAVGPLIELFTHLFTRDKRITVKVKVGDHEVEIESVNMQTGLTEVRRLLHDVLKAP
jgi:hypothetical protein